MLSYKKIVQCATAIVKGMNLKEREAIIIRGGIHAQKLLEEIGILCYKTGAIPLVFFSSDNYTSRVYKEVRTDILELTPKHYLSSIKEADGYILVEPFQDPKIQLAFSPEKISARTKANIPIRKTLYGEEDGVVGKKWTYAGWPTPEAAKFYRVPYSDLEKLVIDGMTISTSTLKNSTSRLAKKLKGANMIHITDKEGTDFTCKIKNRRINEDDGLIDDEDIAVGDLGNNLPAGEVFIAPHETFGEGTLFCPITVDRYTNKIIKNVKLIFKDGKLILNKIVADENQRYLIDSFKNCLKIDIKENLIRTLNIAEIGIGCNNNIDKAIGYILTDEKLGGSIHLAFGSNLGYGGTSKSCMHWDFVTSSSATIEIVETEEKIMKNGKLL